VARLFVAAWPPPEVLDQLAELPRPDEPGVRWTTRDQWHVTLRFLGRADPDEAAAALGGVRAPEATATMGPRIGRLGRAVVVVPVAGLDEVAEAVRGATAEIGEPVDPRPFLGHVTLARVKNRGTCRLTGTAVSAEFPVTEVALVASELHADGARYTTLTTHPLGA
jgi:2'-5' RNA ligase